MNTNLIRVHDQKELENIIFTGIIKSGGNTKLGNSMGTISKLMGDRDYFVPELGMTIHGSCGNYCHGCNGECGCGDGDKPPCYVWKSYVRHTNQNTGECSVIYGHAKTTLAFRQDLARAFASMDLQLSRKRKPFNQIRGDQSGEIENTAELVEYYRLARKHPETHFYLYTKNFDALNASIIIEKMPSNITILVSIWHEYGIAEYKQLQHLPNIKAFVVVDKDWTIERYAEYGIIITTMCGAYNERGRMNKKVTCDVCKKCFDRKANHKVIGCFDHR